MTDTEHSAGSDAGRSDATSHGSADCDAPKERLIQINWPAIWCLVFFILGLVAGRLS